MNKLFFSVGEFIDVPKNKMANHNYNNMTAWLKVRCIAAIDVPFIYSSARWLTTRS